MVKVGSIPPDRLASVPGDPGCSRIEKDDLTQLRTEMARFVGELLKDHAAQIWADEDWHVDVTDESGLILYVMQISATNTAATMPVFRRGG